MKLYCAICCREFPREDFTVTVPERALMWDGKRPLYAFHRACHGRTIMLASATIGRDRTKVR